MCALNLFVRILKRIRMEMSPCLTCLAVLYFHHPSVKSSVRNEFTDRSQVQLEIFSFNLFFPVYFFLKKREQRERERGIK
jgi:RecA-family ATPase